VKKNLLEVRNVKFSYRKGEPVLRGVSFGIERGDFVAVTGPSGSGKSTLFYLLGALVSKFEGEIFFAGREHRQAGERECAILRNSYVGFVFQQFHLLARASVLENVLLPANYPYDTSRPTEADRARALEILNRLGLGDLTSRMPQELSGGQQQRVAIARALIRNPEVILADEPTGNLDTQSTAVVMDIFKSLHAEGKTIVIITHSPEIAEQCSRVISFRDGMIENDRRLHPIPKIEESEILKTVERAPSSPILPYLRALRPAWENIMRTKAKAALTMLGVILGIAAVLTTMSLGTFAKEKILASYEALGVNTAQLTGWSNRRRSARDLAPAVFRSFAWSKDILPMIQIFREVELASPVLYSFGGSFNYAGSSLSDDTGTLGVNEQYLKITNQRLTEGRALTALDIENANPVCVIGFKVKETLFPNENPIDKSLTVVDSQSGEFPCRVVGTLEKVPSQTEGITPDSEVFMPASYLERGLTNPWQREIHEVQMKIERGYDPDSVGEQIEGYFRSRYGSTGEFRVSSNAKVITQMNLFLNVFSSLLTAVAAIALLVGGVGINNMMLVNLAERLKELGLRKALGATPAQIRALVLTESVALCAIGGLTGVISGFIGYHGLIYAATKLIPDMTFEWVIEPLAVLASFSAIVVTGVLSGMVPALRAEKLEVIEALRQDN
jgi:macrolide transport system ATP-binding/permease protein